MLYVIFNPLISINKTAKLVVVVEKEKENKNTQNVPKENIGGVVGAAANNGNGNAVGGGTDNNVSIQEDIADADDQEWQEVQQHRTSLSTPLNESKQIPSITLTNPFDALNDADDSDRWRNDFR